MALHTIRVKDAILFEHVFFFFLNHFYPAVSTYVLHEVSAAGRYLAHS